MSELEIKSLSTLGQASGAYILDNNNAIYSFDNNVTVNCVNDGYILDMANNSNVVINVFENVNLTYYILKSKNTKRTFNVKGNVNVVEISFYESKELLDVKLDLENASFDYKCLSILDKFNANYDIKVYHNKPYTYSNILNTCVAMTGSHCTFDVSGKIEKGMSKSKCSQKTRGIVMDDDSQIIANPILLIDEYDCFANHGASIGKVNDEELFYLMSRGLTKDESVLLILSGMVNPFISVIPSEKLRNEITFEVDHLI
ncbi:MAG: SufD family Fe-S cluster assembly protein [Acholeplasmatales bacterium]|nr:SufD family Fe-S cluster assembly protein [Acholeplasmatales bacterium]